MRLTTHLHMRGTAIAISLGIIGSASAAARARPDRPYIHGVGDLPGGNHNSGAYGISADGGVVVGASDNGWTGPDGWKCEAFRWTAQDGIIGLGDLPEKPQFSQARDVSADGRVVIGEGNFDTHSPHPAQAMRVVDGVMQGLGFPNINYHSSWTTDVSGDGASVLVVGGNLSHLRSYLWTEQAGFLDLGDVPDGTGRIAATAISRDGSVIAGAADSTTCMSNLFRWTREDGIVVIDACSPSNFITTHYFAMTPDGRCIVGYRGASSGDSLFYWTQETGIVLIANKGPDHIGDVEDVSIDGNLMVGYYGLNAWACSRSGVSRNLKPYMVAHGNTDAEGWTMEWASAIADDSRTIVGGGFGPHGWEGWIAKLNRPGDGNGDGLVDISDLLNVIEYWRGCGAPPCTADVAPAPLGDDQLDLADLLMVITNWD